VGRHPRYSTPPDRAPVDSPAPVRPAEAAPARIQRMMVSHALSKFRIIGGKYNLSRPICHPGGNFAACRKKGGKYTYFFCFFSCFNFFFSLGVSRDVFFCSFLPLSLLPFSPISYLPHMKVIRLKLFGEDCSTIIEGTSRAQRLSPSTEIHFPHKSGRYHNCLRWIKRAPPNPKPNPQTTSAHPTNSKTPKPPKPTPISSSPTPTQHTKAQNPKSDSPPASHSSSASRSPN
jgi:hypothetical protein